MELICHFGFPSLYAKHHNLLLPKHDRDPQHCMTFCHRETLHKPMISHMWITTNDFIKWLVERP